jgi:hypothetical protein
MVLPELYPHQKKAVEKMHDGCILCGGVGTGKSITALAYYFYRIAKQKPTGTLYIITTAHKRDSGEWEMECLRWGIPEQHDMKLIIDSWNNIEKYSDVKNEFIIFDEHKAIGSGKWSKCFVKLAKQNNWVLLSATPGDNWIDYIPVMVANGYYRNRTDFIQQHVIINPFVTYFSVKSYINTEKLQKIRNELLVDMVVNKIAQREEIPVLCEYDKELYSKVAKDRWNPYDDKPIENAAELCYILRKVCNSHVSRIKKVIGIANKKSKLIIFYNFDYELEILRKALSSIGITITEWNGHQHDIISSDEHWAHLVQYSAGAEGWNCIETDTIIFYSQSYSYKQTEQAMGRIDRINTPFDTLYYYRLYTDSDIDKAINLALATKHEFNITKFAREIF